MEYLSQAEFKTAFKTGKALGPVTKDYSGPVIITGERQAKFIFSTDSVDREFDTIRQAGVDLTAFKTNPVVFSGHLHHTLPIGKCVSIGVEDGKLQGVIEFASADNPAVGAQAEGIFQLIKEGILSTVSIGFIPTEVERPDDPDRAAADGVDILSCEMIEVSVVGIPCQREATLVQVSPDITPIVEDDPTPEVEPEKQYRGKRLGRILASMD